MMKGSQNFSQLLSNFLFFREREKEKEREGGEAKGKRKNH